MAAHSSDPLIAWTMRVVDPPLRTMTPWLYAIDPVALIYRAARRDRLRHDVGGRHFYVRAWKGLRHRTADMNTLIAIGTGAAFIYSVVATFAPACS